MMQVNSDGKRSFTRYSHMLHFTFIFCLFKEREAIMCKVANAACRGELAQGGVHAPLDSVVMVVGKAHLKGVRGRDSALALRGL